MIKYDKCPLLSSKVGQVSFQNPNFMGISLNESCVMSLDIPDDFIISGYIDDDEDKDKSIESSCS